MIKVHNVKIARRNRIRARRYRELHPTLKYYDLALRFSGLEIRDTKTLTKLFFLAQKIVEKRGLTDLADITSIDSKINPE